MITILIADSGLDEGARLRSSLEEEGYRVLQTANGNRAIELAQQEHPDLAVLMVQLPGLDGLSTCRMIRRTSTLPIIFLASHNDDLEHITALEMGGDDYLVKPMSPGIIVAHVRAVLRRGQHKPVLAQRVIVRKGELVVDIGARRVWRDNNEVILVMKEFDLLLFLIHHQGDVLLFDALREAVSFATHTNTLEVYMRRLRN